MFIVINRKISNGIGCYIIIWTVVFQYYSCSLFYAQKELFHHCGKNLHLFLFYSQTLQEQKLVSTFKKIGIFLICYQSKRMLVAFDVAFEYPFKYFIRVMKNFDSRTSNTLENTKLFISAKLLINSYAITTNHSRKIY